MDAGLQYANQHVLTSVTASRCLFLNIALLQYALGMLDCNARIRVKSFSRQYFRDLSTFSAMIVLRLRLSHSRIHVHLSSPVLNQRLIVAILFSKVSSLSCDLLKMQSQARLVSMIENARIFFRRRVRKPGRNIPPISSACGQNHLLAPHCTDCL